MKKVAVIGYGGQGAWHCAQVLKSDVALLVGTYDIKEQRRNAARDNGIFVYESNEAIFADKDVDIVVVATPNDVHEDLVVNALKSGHNVICEKPVALSVEEFDRMVAAQKESGKRLSVHQNRRWDVDFFFRVLYTVKQHGWTGGPYAAPVHRRCQMSSEGGAQ